MEGRQKTAERVDSWHTLSGVWSTPATVDVLLDVMGHFWVLAAGCYCMLLGAMEVDGCWWVSVDVSG